MAILRNGDTGLINNNNVLLIASNANVGGIDPRSQTNQMRSLIFCKALNVKSIVLVRFNSNHFVMTKEFQIISSQFMRQFGTNRFVTLTELFGFIVNHYFL